VPKAIVVKDTIPKAALKFLKQLNTNFFNIIHPSKMQVTRFLITLAPAQIGIC
jgi:hypothetical protein